MNQQQQILEELGYRPAVRSDGRPYAKRTPVSEKKIARHWVRSEIEAIHDKRALERELGELA